MTENAKIVYTWTDEAPALATLSFLPIVKAFTGAAGVEVETADISLAGRVLAAFSDQLPADQAVPDTLAELGELAKRPEANIIKLPNISASVPQLKEAVAELQAAGFAVPDYPDEPETADEHDARARFDKVKGSAVNPVLREGNSDRRAPRAVKRYAQKNPHSMGAWSSDSETHVATMSSGDFRSNEQSTTMATDGHLRIEHVGADGETTILKQRVNVLADEVVDATFMSRDALVAFLDEQVADARETGVLFSLHLKATMMKVSDPIIFGHAVRSYFAALFGAHGERFDELGVNVNNGLGNLLAALEEAPVEERDAIKAQLLEAFDAGPDLAMVDSDRGITNLHVPSDVIVDASMPAMIRASGMMWNKDGEQQDTKAVIPDSSYAPLYIETVNFHRENGAFDPTTMGTVPNVGLMAQKAEEYGSHDKTFEMQSAGTVRVIDQDENVVFEQVVGEGDIWRMCQVKQAPIADWVKLAITRARATGWPAVFWLDAERAHDAELIKQVEAELAASETEGLELHIMNVADATNFTLDRVAKGQDTISVTGNVLRDYLTDLFPILELGTSAKMLSIVPLMNGGGLFETGAGGSAPKHVQQFTAENHLRWDSLGEFLALAVSLEHLAESCGNETAALLGDALHDATERLLDEGKSPSRKVNELDNRGSHFYLAMFWADAMASQSQDAALAERFGALAASLHDQEEAIVAELNTVQGEPREIGGYYWPDRNAGAEAMRPSPILNGLIDSF